MKTERNLAAVADYEDENNMPRRALLVGIDKYDNDRVPNLSCCVSDAKGMCSLLRRHEDGSPNYECRLLVGTGREKITRKVLRSEWNNLFRNYRGEILFYFSGHGAPLESGGYLVTQEGDPDDPGLGMDELLVLANRCLTPPSQASSVLLILDCCNAGHLGSPAILNGTGSALLQEGLTIMAASRPTESAFEIGGHGVFTRLLLGALAGGASDVRGQVSAASIYAYVEQSLGSWDQRPLYKSHADHLEPVRICRPKVPDSLLRELPVFFKSPGSVFRLDPSYEFTHKTRVKEHVKIFDKFKLFRNAGLLETVRHKDLYFAAMKKGTVRLTPLGQFYRELAVEEKL